MAKARRTPAVKSLKIVEFLGLVHDGVRGRIGDALDGFDTRQRFGYVQYYRGDPATHYEVWVQRRTGRLEIGLHFEGPDAARNYEALELLSMRAPDIAAAVGPEYEPEEWTKAWTRLHRSFDAPSLTPELADEAAERVVALIRGMEPLLHELGLVPAMDVQSVRARSRARR